MTTQHTPAPWSISPPCELSPRYSVYHNGPLVYVDRAEDARLIAAAPDLLAVLQQANAWVSQYHGVNGHDAASRQMSNVIRAAIAKATGETL